MKDIRDILEQVKSGELSVDEALLDIKKEPFKNLDYARVDLHRRVRQGACEVIYGAGKSAEQISGIASAMIENGQDTILITRMTLEKAEEMQKTHELFYHKEARIGIIGPIPEPKSEGFVLVLTGGTSDIPVAEEAALTAEVMGCRVKRIYDVGVAGVHRLLSVMDDICGARVIIAVAGMEGALASVVGGLAQAPVIAVPTSEGYGASFGGLSALLSMLNSCASGVSVVNIDNGFGAGFLAARINKL